MTWARGVAHHQVLPYFSLVRPDTVAGASQAVAESGGGQERQARRRPPDDLPCLARPFSTPARWAVPRPGCSSRRAGTSAPTSGAPASSAAATPRRRPSSISDHSTRRSRRAMSSISLVPPAAALETAQAVSGAARQSGRQPLFLDANSVAPATMSAIAATLEGAELDCVDGAFVGSAAELGGRTRLYLSGSRAGELAAALPEAFHGAQPRAAGRRRLGSQARLRRLQQGARGAVRRSDGGRRSGR